MASKDETTNKLAQAMDISSKTLDLMDIDSRFGWVKIVSSQELSDMLVEALDEKE